MASRVTMDVTQGATTTTVFSSVDPKVRSVKETLSLSEFTDGAGASGTVAMTNALPVGAQVLGVAVEVIDACASATSATLDVGDGSDADRFGDAVDVTSEGLAVGVAAGTNLVSTAVAPTVTLTDATGAGADFGNIASFHAVVEVIYVM